MASNRKSFFTCSFGEKWHTLMGQKRCIKAKVSIRYLPKYCLKRNWPPGTALNTSRECNGDSRRGNDVQLMEAIFLSDFWEEVVAVVIVGITLDSIQNLCIWCGLLSISKVLLHSSLPCSFLSSSAERRWRGKWWKFWKHNSQSNSWNQHLNKSLNKIFSQYDISMIQYHTSALI